MLPRFQPDSNKRTIDLSHPFRYDSGPGDWLPALEDRVARAATTEEREYA